MEEKNLEFFKELLQINTPCEIQEIKKDTAVTLLPQLNKNFVQNQFSTEILTQTPNIVKPSDFPWQHPAAMPFIIALSILISLLVFTILATALTCILIKTQCKLKLKRKPSVKDITIEELKPVEVERFL